jgi:hypothetical protein
MEACPECGAVFAAAQVGAVGARLEGDPLPTGGEALACLIHGRFVSTPDGPLVAAGRGSTRLNL